MEHVKELLEEAAFLVSQKNENELAHKKIIQALIAIDRLQGEEHNMKKTLSNENEINKVSRRLKLWAKRPDQMNTKILKSFLKLKISGKITVTEKDLKTASGDELNFESNFAQMKIISEKNHGKIFDVYGDKVSIWEPVSVYVDTFKKDIFGEV